MLSALTYPPNLTQALRDPQYWKLLDLSINSLLYSERIDLKLFSYNETGSKRERVNEGHKLQEVIYPT